MKHTFQALSASNAQNAYNILLDCHVFPWSQDIFESCLDGQYFAFQMLNEQQTLGYYVGLQVLNEGTLMDICIDKHYRGQGLGKALLQNFLQQCQQRDLDEVWLEVRASNISAITLYQQSRFELIERRKNYYQTLTGREDALIMRMTF